MSATVYDEHSEFYIDFVDRSLAAENGYVSMLLETIASCLGDRVAGARICDLCCGEGYVSRHLMAHGAREAVGIDLSEALIAEARRRANTPGLTYRVDDAEELQSASDGEFEVVVSHMAMMDVGNHRKVFAAVRRVLVPGGPFVFSLLHPCFEGRPFHVETAPPFILGEDGKPVAYAVRRYATEGFFRSGGDGVRGRIGANHRTLSTYINDLLASGFVLERLEEPLAGDNASQIGLFSEVPTALVIAARAV